MSKLYQIRPNNSDRVLVIADSPNQAANVYVTWAASRGHVLDDFSIELVPAESFPSNHQTKLQSALALGLIGVARFNDDGCWIFDHTEFSFDLPLGGEG